MSHYIPAGIDPVFFIYAICTIGLLVFAGGMLLLLSVGFKKNIDSIWCTYRSWLIMIPIVLCALSFGRVTTLVGIGLLAVFGFKEFACATGLYRDWWYTGAVYLGISRYI